MIKDVKRVWQRLLKSPERVMALVYELNMTLSVYSLIDWRARQAPAEADEPTPPLCSQMKGEIWVQSVQSSIRIHLLLGR